MAGNVYVTIIIPVYKDWTRLSLCLKALQNQSYTGKFEIIVVNNDPQDNIPAGYALPPQCSLITEGRPGSYAARNAAINLARGEILGFTDSDCIPDQDWIKNAVEHFSNDKTCCRIGGKISLFFKSDQPTQVELYDKLYSLNQKRYVTKWGSGVTANLFTYRHVFDSIGLFNETLLSGGDYYWGILAHKAGYRIDYVENVIVNHPARYTLSQLIKKEKRIGGGLGSHSQKAEDKSPNLLGYLRLTYYFLKELWPSSQELRYINNNSKGLKTKNKVYLFGLRYYLRSVRAYEKFKVRMGKKAERA